MPRLKIPKTIYSNGAEILNDVNNGNKYVDLRMGPEEKMQFRVYVKEILRKRNMTIQDLANELGIPVKTLYNYFSRQDTQMRGRTAAMIANYFKISKKNWYGQKVSEKDRQYKAQTFHIESLKTYKKVKKKRERAARKLAKQQANETK